MFVCWTLDSIGVLATSAAAAATASASSAIGDLRSSELFTENSTSNRETKGEKKAIYLALLAIIIYIIEKNKARQSRMI